MCHVTLTTPLSGMTCRQQVGLATVNLQAKFEVSNYTHYEDNIFVMGVVRNFFLHFAPLLVLWEAVQNVQIGLVSGGYGSLKVIGNVTVR